MPVSRLDQPTVYGARAKLGVIVPPTNTANEAEWNRAVPNGVTVHSARMSLHADTESAAGKAALHDDIGRFARDLAQASVDVVAYGCTAGSMITPVTELPEFMARETGVRAVTTAQAIVEALKALGARKLAIATPYHAALNDHEVRFLADQGFETVSIDGLGYGAGGPAEYRNIARVPPEEVFAFARRVDQPEADTLLISCTDFATFDVIDRLEAELGKPVVTSNQATLWLTLRTAGIEDRLTGYGRLLADY